MFERWARAKLPALPGASLETVRLAGRTPVILIDVPGDSIDTVLLYGHLDKQPEMVGWTDGFGLGFRGSRVTSSTAAVVRTTATRCSAR
jgi:hypothetical protein